MAIATLEVTHPEFPRLLKALATVKPSNPRHQRIRAILEVTESFYLYFPEEGYSEIHDALAWVALGFIAKRSEEVQIAALKKCIQTLKAINPEMTIINVLESSI